MIEKILVRPIKGLIVRDPITKAALPPKGLHVQKNSYWLRREKEGSIVIIDDNAPVPSEPVVEKQTKPKKTVKRRRKKRV